MVKGVSKTIIEVNNTGSKYFEKIVFYVTPQYGNLNAKQLKRAASSFAFNFEAASPKMPLRKRCKRKNKIKFLIISGVCLVLLTLLLLLIL